MTLPQAKTKWNGLSDPQLQRTSETYSQTLRTLSTKSWHRSPDQHGMGFQMQWAQTAVSRHPRQASSEFRGNKKQQLWSTPAGPRGPLNARTAQNHLRQQHSCSTIPKCAPTFIVQPKTPCSKTANQFWRDTKNFPGKSGFVFLFGLKSQWWLIEDTQRWTWRR